jgi:hypothetical protein
MLQRLREIDDRLSPVAQVIVALAVGGFVLVMLLWLLM